MQIVLLLGGNQGDIEDNFNIAEKKIELQIGHIINQSSLYESKAWGFEAENNFLNKVIICESELESSEILYNCLKIESELGRIRLDTNNYTSRTIDIDILFINNKIIKTPDSIVPHPRLQLRNFTLMPLCEVMPDFIHPIEQKTCKQLLSICNDNSKVWKI